MSEPIRIAMWSGPRNISTAMMRAWENREDTWVTDEPLYAHYLLATGAPHPGREQIIASQPGDWRRVVATLRGPVPHARAVWYQKHMAQHFTAQMDTEWLGDLTNVFLIRDPDEVVASFAQRREEPAAWELGFDRQAVLFDAVLERTGRTPLVFDARDVLADPERALRALCAGVGVTFTERMLHWPAGPRASDGVWAKYWYDTVHASTSFAPYQVHELTLSDSLQRLADACRPYYERLHRYRWSAREPTGAGLGAAGQSRGAR